MRRQWTSNEEEILVRLRSSKTPFKVIAATLGRSVGSCDTRYRWLTMPSGARIDRAEQRAAAKRANREAKKVNQPVISAIPDHVIRERARRMSAPVTLTGMLFGDPPIGFSALDRQERV